MTRLTLRPLRKLFPKLLGQFGRIAKLIVVDVDILRDYCFDAPPDAVRSLALLDPDRLEQLEDVARFDLGDREVPDCGPAAARRDSPRARYVASGHAFRRADLGARPGITARACEQPCLDDLACLRVMLAGAIAFTLNSRTRAPPNPAAVRASRTQRTRADLDDFCLEPACGRNAGKPAADDQDALFLGSRRNARVFRRAAVGQTCAHGRARMSAASRLPPIPRRSSITLRRPIAGASRAA
jgi:hypothetical protein